MVKTEPFSITMTIPEYLIDMLDRNKGDLSRSKYAAILLEENLDKMEEIFKKSKTRSISLNLPYETISKAQEMAEKYEMTPGRVIYLTLLFSLPNLLYGSDLSPADPLLKKE